MMLFMRTTVRIEDDLLLDLKEKARLERISLTRALNQTLRAGLRTERESRRPSQRYRERTHSMGVPKVDLTKALSIAGQLEDQEVLRKERLRK